MLYPIVIKNHDVINFDYDDLNKNDVDILYLSNQSLVTKIIIENNQFV
jgi:hypothetical protein